MSAVTFHCFLPFADALVLYPVAGDTLEVDLAPRLLDYIRFHQESCTLYVIPIGHSGEAGESRRHLGPLLVFRFPTGGR